MSNDLILSILFICYTGMCLGIGALAGMMRRDTEVRRERLLADRRSADLDSQWDTTIRDKQDEWN